MNPFFTLQSPIEAVRVLLLGIIETFASNKVHIYILHLNLLSPPRCTLCSMSTSTRRMLNRPNPRQCILRRSSFQQDRIPSPRIWLTYLKRDNISTTRHLFNLSVDERYRLIVFERKRLLSDSEVRGAWQREAYHSIQWLHRLISQHKNITT